MYTNFNHFLLLQQEMYDLKSIIMPATSPLFCNSLPSKTRTTANIDTIFSNVQHFKVYSKQFIY